MSLFKNPNDPDNSKITKLVKDWVREKFPSHKDAIITVTELQCSDPGCPDMETVIAIYDEKKVQFKIRKPLNYVRKWDIANLSI